MIKEDKKLGKSVARFVQKISFNNFEALFKAGLDDKLMMNTQGWMKRYDEEGVGTAIFIKVDGGYRIVNGVKSIRTVRGGWACIGAGDVVAVERKKDTAEVFLIL